MNIASEDPLIQRFYDLLFDQAARLVASGATHPPVIVLLEPTGKTYASNTAELSKEQRASLLMSLAVDPRFHAAALVAESWYADARHEGADVDQFLSLAQEGRLCDYPGRREAIIISVITAARQAVMICPIDRTTNAVHKPPFEWVGTDAAGSLTGTYIRPSAPTPS